jgi:hypothetical protein
MTSHCERRSIAAPQNAQGVLPFTRQCGFGGGPGSKVMLIIGAWGRVGR